MTCGTCGSKTCGTKIERPILRELPFAFGVRLFRADGTPHDLSQFSIQCGIKNALGVVTPFSVTTGTGLFVLSLTQAQTTALANGTFISDILVRQGNEVFRRAELVFRVETPRTVPTIDPQLISTPDPVLELRDTAVGLIQLPGGTDVATAIAAAIAAHESSANPHPQYAKQRGWGLTITTNGQTVIPLPVAVTDPTRVGVYLNTTRQRYGVDWAASGTSLTWLATNLTLTTTDALEILI